MIHEYLYQRLSMQTGRQAATEEAGLVPYITCLSVSFSISHMKFWIDVLVVTALQNCLLCLEISPSSPHLEILSNMS